ncbi:Ferric-chelate reductase [Ophiocordyceps camponoti-floridani]|uniref:ferric-chelate reductase (NADPH) n=1 Tax=Ophiocordyceps camponoti-floridani TaxID=2030778 RepID=A0A8H4VE27_9HYPO|nr:Ferric-chelate reductase [Ophiocordyceps camponoti-floridani]
MYRQPLRRHIQDLSDGSAREPHWGYADRVVPCKKDAGTCAYLDLVYAAHDRSMLYVGIFWATICAVLAVWIVARFVSRPVGLEGCSRSAGRMTRLSASLASARRRLLLPVSGPPWLFGRGSRAQLLVLATLTGYIMVWSFVGIAYRSWLTPVKGNPAIFSTRTSLGPWSNRIGVVAFGLTPLSVLLSCRESLLSVLTGLPYQTFGFLHRWLGYIIFAQSSLHTISWCVIQLRLYQPQPKTGLEWIKEKYIIWGLVAMILLLLLFLLSTPWAIRRAGYEFFRKTHYVLAMVYIGACWGHWERLQCFLIPSFIFWGLDRAARLVRTALLHYHPWAKSGLFSSFETAEATIKMFKDDTGGQVVRLDLENDQDTWKVGQHFFLCFPRCSFWQSHPFTPLNLPVLRNGSVRHSYIIRSMGGETRKLTARHPSTSVLLTGPYGEDVASRVASRNVICVAGGTGIAYVMPLLLRLAQQQPIPDRRIELVWAVRHLSHVEWVREEMDSLQRSQKTLNLTVRVFATRDGETPLRDKAEAVSADPSPSDEPVNNNDGMSIHKTGDGVTESSRHPDLHRLVTDFVESTVSGPTAIVASGPGGVLTDLRAVAAGINSPSKVWKGKTRFDVDLILDDRMEW